jgi:glycosyltransferase involved in cell wall biosynthesis
MSPSVLLSVVIPVCNEAEVLPALQQRMLAVLDSLPMTAEIIYVNDGSSDDSLKLLEDFREADPRIAVLDLSRNFGKEIAMTAGLDHARGDAVVVIDSDLQDPPELIPRLLEKWQEGYDVVYATRTSRKGDSFLKKLTAYAFYRVMRIAGSVRLPSDTGDFRLLSRRAVNALRGLRERHRFMKGLFTWIGYRQTGIPYERDPRYAGQTKWQYWKLWNFALEGITSFTTAPLIIATYIGFITAISAFIFGLIIIYKTLVYGDPVAGYPSLMVVILFLGGIQLMSIGVIGEYLGRMFDESKQRPLYLVSSYTPAKAAISPDERVNT